MATFAGSNLHKKQTQKKLHIPIALAELHIWTVNAAIVKARKTKRKCLELGTSKPTIIVELVRSVFEY